MSGAGTGTTTGTAPVAGGQVVNGVPVAAPVGLDNGGQVALMALAAALLVGVAVVPAVIAQNSTRRRDRRNTGPPYDPRDGG